MSKSGPANNSSVHERTQAVATGRGSALGRYQDLILGRRSLWGLLYYEWCMWLGLLPGALGLLLRGLFWPRLFASCGRGVAFAAGVVVRHPKRIHLGHRVVVSEGCILDGRHPGSDRALVLDDDVMLSNQVLVSCKHGSVKVGPRSGLGPQTIIQSANDNDVVIGADVIIGPRCYLVGGSNYNIDRLDVPISSQGIKPDGGIQVDDGVWLGGGVIVLGGVRLGAGSVAGAGAVITQSLPARAICHGVPARISGWRGQPPDQSQAGQPGV